MSTNQHRKVLAITYYGRSGSVFLQSLLDNHPNCITIPGCYIMGIQDWFDNLKSYDTKYVIDRFCSDYKVLFDPYYVSKKDIAGCGRDPGLTHNFHKVGKDKNEIISIDEKKFTNYLKSNINFDTIKIADFFEFIHQAYAFSLNKKLESNDWIVFQLHSPLYRRARFLKEFDTKILSIIRDPVQSALSLVKHININNNRKKKLVPLFISTLNNYKPIAGFENVTRSIKLEDLHLNSKETLSKVLDWINIPWHKNLLSSTFNGKLWYNLSNTEQVQGFNNIIIKKTHDEYANNLDKALFIFLFIKLYKSWNYSYKNISIFGYFRPLKMEKDDSLFEIFKNRVRIFRIMVLNLKNTKLNSKIYKLL